MRSVQASLPDISGLKGFPNLTPVDPKSHLTSTEKQSASCTQCTWYTYKLNIKSVKAFLEISCLQGFNNLTHVDLKWLLTSTKNYRLLLLNVVHLHTKYELCPSFPAWHRVYKVFTIWPRWPQMTFDLHQKQKASFTQCGTPIYQIWALSKLSLLRYRVYKVFTIWPLLTPNDLWPPPKSIGFLYSMWYTYILNMRSVQASLLEISCLQGFNNLTLLTSNDFWPPPKTIGCFYSMCRDHFSVNKLHSKTAMQI